MVEVVGKVEQRVTTMIGKQRRLRVYSHLAYFYFYLKDHYIGHGGTYGIVAMSDIYVVAIDAARERSCPILPQILQNQNENGDNAI